MQFKREHDIKIAFSDQTNLIEQSAYHYSLQERENRLRLRNQNLIPKCKGPLTPDRNPRISFYSQNPLLNQTGIIIKVRSLDKLPPAW